MLTAAGILAGIAWLALIAFDSMIPAVAILGLALGCVALHFAIGRGRK